MTLEPLTCNNCGSALDVPANVRFVSCAYCGSRLAVRRTESAAYTEVLERLDQRAELMAGDIEAIRLQNELERVDREWQMEREQWMVRNKDGSVGSPSATGPFVAVVITLFGLVTVLSMDGVGTSVPIPVIILVFFGLAVAGFVAAVSRSQSHGAAEAAYRQRREELVRQLEENRIPQAQDTE